MTQEPTGLPDTFVQRLQTFVPDDVFARIMQAFAVARPTTFRVNHLKSDEVTVHASLTAQGFELESVPWYPGAYILVNRDLRALTETAEYANGHLYVQSLSSMLPPLVLDPKPGEKILDIASAPGSKTTEIADLMHNSGEIVANDSSPVRIYRLKANLHMQGVNIATVIRDDGRSVWKKYPEYFDKTLVDVPCSMEGRFQIGYPKTYEDWSVKKVQELSRLQRWILRSAISATKPGGTIVYSTCTLSPEENEEVVNWILEKEQGNIIVVGVQVSNLALSTGITAWGEKTFDPALAKTARIYPTDRMEGFYIAKFKKIRTSVPKAMRR